MTRWRTVLRLGGVLVATLALGACTVGRYYRGAPLRADPETLIAGQSTKADVLRLLGPPDVITHQTDGDAFVYAYTQRNFSSITIQEPFFNQLVFSYRRQFENHDSVVVLFDFLGIVQAVAKKSQTPDMPML